MPGQRLGWLIRAFLLAGDALFMIGILILEKLESTDFGEGLSLVYLQIEKYSTGSG